MHHTILPVLACIFLTQWAPVLDVHASDWCRLTGFGTHVTDLGDGDGIADTNETLEIALSLHAFCSGLRDCVAWLSTESPAIDCMRRSEIQIGDLPGSAPPVTPEETFEIKIGDVDRHDLGLGPEDLLEAKLTVEVRCQNDSGVVSVRQVMTLPLDRNLSDLGQPQVEWREDFEGGGVDPQDPLLGTAFFAENLDAGLPGNNNTEGLINADGWRCQYSDPEWRNAASYNHAQGEVCYPAMNLSHANAVYWRIDGSLVPDSPDGGRAFVGEKSLYYGVFLGWSDENFTTPLSTVESAATRDLINLGVGAPELSFWHQISLADYRSINSDVLQNIDRGVVQISMHDSAGAPTGEWMNLQPFQNSYDQQAETNYFNCMFDPIDDGNNEDDYFDPTDPFRDLGPSSTCFPSFSWAHIGSTTGCAGIPGVICMGNAGSLWRSTDLPPRPSLGLGWNTWVETRVDLSEFRGRRARIRFLVTSLKGTAETHVGQFGPDRDERDDGWWIDEITIDETLAEPAVFTHDSFLLGSCTGTDEPCIAQCRDSLAACSASVPCGLGEGDCVRPCPPGDACAGPPPDCGTNCAHARVNLFVEPDGPLNPESVSRSELGAPVSVNFAAPLDLDTGAEPSWVDVCIDGRKEYRACISGDPDGDLSGLPDADCDDAWDRPICESCAVDWSLESAMISSLDTVATYAVEVRCSSVPFCRDGRTLEIDVECFGGAPNTYGLRDVRALNEEMLTWRGTLDVDWLRGSFSTGADIGAYVADFTDVAIFATSIPMNGDPPVGTGYYYLVKADGPANPSDFYSCSTRTWRSGGTAEAREPARNDAFGDP